MIVIAPDILPTYPRQVLCSESIIHQQMHCLLILENFKIYVKTSNFSYMFQSTTIVRELTLEPG
jgi:hypothetical protein